MELKIHHVTPVISICTLNKIRDTKLRSDTNEDWLEVNFDFLMFISDTWCLAWWNFDDDSINSFLVTKCDGCEVGVSIYEGFS